MKDFVWQNPARQDNTDSREGVGASGVKFPDLSSAGRELAEGLRAYSGRAGALVVGIVRGGLPAATEVALALDLPLDLIVLRRLLAPPSPLLPVCAANVCGTLVLDEELPAPAAPPRSPLEHFIAEALEGLALRAQTCRGARPPTDISGRTVILVDNGIHTGSTMLVALRALRRLRPARVVAAIPVASPEGQAAVAAEADEIICLATHHPFGHVGLWYKGFTPPEDSQTRELLERARAPQTL